MDDSYRLEKIMSLDVFFHSSYGKFYTIFFSPQLKRNIWTALYSNPREAIDAGINKIHDPVFDNDFVNLEQENKSKKEPTE